MPNYIEYRKSISLELKSIKNRVRSYVSHWPEDGRYKEIILKNVLERHLPKNVSVGTGFVIGEASEQTSQIDIIVYSNVLPPLFCLEDFVIVSKEAVLGVIEVKTTIRNNEFNRIMSKAHKNGKLIGNHIFNGIFAYEADVKKGSGKLPPTLESSLVKFNGYVNNISFGEDIFMKYWNAGFPKNSHAGTQPNNQPHYSFYDIKELSFGYFISNLIEDAYIQCNQSEIPKTLKRALYPIEQTKEAFLIPNYEIILH